MRKYLYTFLLPIAIAIPAARAQWSPVCSTGNGFVVDFEPFNGQLVATGFFTSLCNNSVSYIAGWNGSTWMPVGTGLPRAGHALEVINNQLYSVGYQPANDSNWLYVYDGSAFNKVGEGVFLTTFAAGGSRTPNLYKVIPYNGSLIVSGEFDRAGNKAISGIMRWTGSQWDSLGAGLSGSIHTGSAVMYPHDMCVHGTDLVVGGAFQLAGGQVANGIARWDGNQWTSYGQGFNGTVYGLAVFNGELYAAGEFTASGTTPLPRIAKWNGTAWVAPGFRLYYDNPAGYTYLHTLKVTGNKLVIAGGFDRAATASDTMICAGIVTFDGNLIDTLSGGLTGREVEAVAVYNGKLTAGGGGFNAGYIAVYTAPVGVSEIQPGPMPSITLYPHPAAENITFSSTRPVREITVYDIMGRQVGRHFPGSETGSIPLFQAGHYLIVFMTGEYRVVKRATVR